MLKQLLLCYKTYADGLWVPVRSSMFPALENVLPLEARISRPLSCSCPGFNDVEGISKYWISETYNRPKAIKAISSSWHVHHGITSRFRRTVVCVARKCKKYVFKKVFQKLKQMVSEFLSYLDISTCCYKHFVWIKIRHPPTTSPYHGALQNSDLGSMGGRTNREPTKGCSVPRKQFQWFIMKDLMHNSQLYTSRDENHGSWSWSWGNQIFIVAVRICVKIIQ